MKTLLDVGGNTGQTVRAALDPAFGFDRIVTFEPAAECWPEIESIDDARVELCRFGLWRETCESQLHDPGSEAASIFDDFEAEDHSGNVSTVNLVKASDWVAANISEGDIVFMKLNCEGAECDIIEDLLDADQFGKIYNVMVTFDVRKSPSQRGRELPLRQRLLRGGYQNVVYAEDVLRGETHADRIVHWLNMVGARDDIPLAELRVKYGPLLGDLSQRKGRLARLEVFLRAHFFRLLPDSAKPYFAHIWKRFMRGRRQGPA